MNECLISAKTPFSPPMELLNIGFIDVGHFKGSLLEQADVDKLRTLVGPPPSYHPVIECVSKGLAGCKTWLEHAQANHNWNEYSQCQECKTQFLELSYYLSSTAWM